jgi:alpha-galactosidase
MRQEIRPGGFRMPIIYNETAKQLLLHTKHTSYIMEIYAGAHLAHVYWGKTVLNPGALDDIYPCCYGVSFCATDLPGHSFDSTDKLPCEYPTYGSADLRTPAFHARYADGSTVTGLKYRDHRIWRGKPSLAGLPATYGTPEETESLEIHLEDRLTGLSVYLLYTVFEEKDVITRSVRMENRGSETTELQQIYSCCLDFPDAGFELLHLDGSWARERHIARQKLVGGVHAVGSARGASSHNHNPFIALVRPDTREDHGDAYGFSFVYSGNFSAGAEVDQFYKTRVWMGLGSFDFSWRLAPGETFQAPEVVMAYSPDGLGGMSRIYHRLYRENLIHGEYQQRERPVLANNWEATYFEFNEEKILQIAAKAKDIGIDLMVLDDGWFGKRDHDRCSLGDWEVNRLKLPNGLDGLGQKIENMGMRFGLWFEPEMVSPDSDLYRAHPDWCLHVKGRSRSEGRWQLILDLSRDDVCDHIIRVISDIIGNAPISYVKWDMNRNMTEVGSALLPPEWQREVPHRYMLGLYRVLESITTSFPQVLFESCSGGGGRFDPGMLYFMPQTWCSDDTDAIERIYIQYGTSLVYPVSSMGAHVSTVPNHQTGRVTSLSLRGAVAMSGQFGYELDLSRLGKEEIEEMKRQVAFYKEYRDVIQQGDMFRLLSPFEGNQAAWQFISKDKETVILFYFIVQGRPNMPCKMVRLQGLCGSTVYVDAETTLEHSGERLMNLGIAKPLNPDGYSHIQVLKKSKTNEASDQT